MRRLLLLVIGTALVTATAAYAHHSYAATYDVTREVKLEGKLVQFVLRNPHSFVHIEARDDKGAAQRWAVEWAGTAQLGNQGVQRETLKVGDLITITGRPSRVPGEYRALMLSLRRPLDGFSWGSRTGEAVD
ncbi:MAG TPA: DUF6152 family protein [Vicinamibacterales bacterium]|nr:DUF6152 family protein [Vicinamibacterales bacterium]